MSFNGAAPARGRKLTLARLPAGRQISFNGAAPARGRKFPLKYTEPSGYSMLQRGRPRAGAEIAPLLLLVAQARNT